MNVLIVEDESHTAVLLKEMIEQDAEFLVVETVDSVADAVHFLGVHQGNIDLIFLDIHLADGHSFEIFKHVDVQVPVVFCTAYDAYTLQAIKHNGIDYIQKPFNDEDVQQALRKYQGLVAVIQKNAYRGLMPPEPTAARSFQRNFITQQKGRSLVIASDEVAMFFIDVETVYLLTQEGQKSPVFKKLEYIESACDPEHFFRINRQMIVNRRAVQSFEPYFNRKLIVHLSVPFPEHVIVSRLKCKPFQDWLEG